MAAFGAAADPKGVLMAQIKQETAVANARALIDVSLR
jgi:hypothetical protein